MTTNGIALPRLARSLRSAGLTRLNIHVDTLNPERLRRIMRFATLAEIEAGIEAAREAGLYPSRSTRWSHGTTTKPTWWTSRAGPSKRAGTSDSSS